MSAAGRIGDPFDCGDFVAEGSGDVFINEIPLSHLDALSTSHTCGPSYWPAEIIIKAASTVFVNNKNAANVGTLRAAHCCGPSCHTATISDGSPNVNIE